MNNIDMVIALLAVSLVVYSVSRVFSKKTCDCDECPSSCGKCDYNAKK